MLSHVFNGIVHVLKWKRLGKVESYFLVCCISSIMCTLGDRSMWILGLVLTASNVVLMMASSKNFRFPSFSFAFLHKRNTSEPWSLNLLFSSL